MHEKEITHKGKRIYYRTMGEGPVVVLLHGVPFTGELWRYQFPALPDYKLVIPDLPGSGHSEALENSSMEGMADCIRDIIVHETASLYFKAGEPDSVVVIGHSMGGYITLALAEKYPELLNGFGLFHSTAYADTVEKKAARQKTIDLIREKGVPEFVQKSISNLYSPLTRQQNPGLIDQQISASCNFSASAIVSYYQAMMSRPDRRGVLKNSSVPVLFILGKYDTAVSLKDGLEQCALPDLAYIHVLEQAGHVGMNEEPEESNTILLNYLKSIYRHTQ